MMSVVVSRDDAREAFGRPGRFEGCSSAFEVYVALLADSGVTDAEDGVVDSPVGWFARVGRWLVTCDDRGFWQAYRFSTVEAAAAMFAQAAAVYAEWCDDDQEG